MSKKWPLIVSFLLAIVFGFFVLFFVVFPLKYKKEIKEFSAEYNLNSGLVAALIFAESRFNKNAKSSAGALGLMQLAPETFAWIENQLGEENQDVFDPKTNIKYGCYYLCYLFEKYNNEIFVLACYNAGEGVVSSWGEPSNFSDSDIKFAETKSYVAKIQKIKRFYQIRMSN